MEYKAGFINIIGNPNVGKSTLMNALLGEKLSIVTPKAQTTRHRILGILDGENYQMIISDTPGILKPHYKLQEAMMKSVVSALTDADILVYMTDVVETPDKNLEVLSQLKDTSIPLLLLINKIDVAPGAKLAELAEFWTQTLPKAEIFPTSALQGKNIPQLKAKLIELLPVHPPYYPSDEISDRTERFFVAEIIREKIFLFYKEEIPYSCEVEVEAFQEEENLIRISAVINVLRDSQKGILIGNKGASLKRTGTAARKDIEKFLGKKVYLELFVKIAQNWRDNKRYLKQFGYGREQ